MKIKSFDWETSSLSSTDSDAQVANQLGLIQADNICNKHEKFLPLKKLSGPEKGRLCLCKFYNLKDYLFRAGVFGHSFGSFGDCVLGEFTRKEKSHSSLDFPRCNSGTLVIVSQTGTLSGDTFKDVIDEAIHDAHRFAGDSRVRMNLLQNLVDVDCVRFLPLALLFLVGLGNVLLGFTSFLDCLSTRFGCHVENLDSIEPHLERFKDDVR